MPVEEFFEKLSFYFRENVNDICEYKLSKEDISATWNLVKNKYSKWEWNFGKSPEYTFHNYKKFPFGLVDLRLTVIGGIIESIHLSGDFFGLLDKAELESLFKNVRHEREAITCVTRTLDLQKYICGITQQQFLNLF